MSRRLPGFAAGAVLRGKLRRPPWAGARRSRVGARAGGFLDRDQLVSRYAELSGRDVSDLGYWMAFNAWRSAAISEGVYRRYIDGKMGALPDDVEIYARGVERSVDAGLVAAGLA